MFDMDNLNPAIRFYYEDDKKEWVELRLAADVDTERIRKEVGIKTKTEYHRDRRTGRHERLEYVDADEEKIVLFAEALNNFIIADWALFTNDGKKIDCTKENKNKLMRGSPRFAEFIAECTEQLRKDIRIQEDKELKNSENISID